MNLLYAQKLKLLFSFRDTTGEFKKMSAILCGKKRQTGTSIHIVEILNILYMVVEPLFNCKVIFVLAEMLVLHKLFLIYTTLSQFEQISAILDRQDRHFLHVCVSRIY